MPSYRLCFVSRASGAIVHRYQFDCADDGSAEAFADVWSEEAPMELWRGGLRLRRWDAKPGARAGGQSPSSFA